MTFAQRLRTAPFSLWILAWVGLLAHPLLLLGIPIGIWLLPLAATLACVCSRPRIADLGRWPVWIIIAAVTLGVVYGALATMDRSWDGLATWTANARWLTQDGTLEHPYFRDPNVFNYGRGYPLLQPILLAQGMTWLGEHGGRLLFPALWLLLVTSLAPPLRRAGLDGRPLDLMVLGLALVPMFIEPGGGSAASGFADLLVAVLVLHAIIAVAEDLNTPAMLACFLLPMAKGEGFAHLLIFVIVAAFAGRRAAARGAAIGGVIGLAIWLPLQSQLKHPGAPFSLDVLAVALAPALAWGLATMVQRTRSRILVLGTAIVLTAGLAALSALDHTSVGAAVRRLATLDLDWGNLPDIVGVGLGQFVFVRKLGLTFILLIAVGWVLYRRHGLGELRPLFGILVLAGTAIVAFMATRNDGSLDLFLREGITRYTAQWIGPAWLVIGLSIARLRSTGSRWEPAQSATG